MIKIIKKITILSRTFEYLKSVFFLPYITLDNRKIYNANVLDFCTLIVPFFVEYINDNNFVDEKQSRILLKKLIETKVLCANYNEYLNKHNIDYKNITKESIKYMSKLESLAFLTYLYRNDYHQGGYDKGPFFKYTKNGVIFEICKKFIPMN